MDKEKIAWLLTLCVVAFALAPPIHRLSRAVEGWAKKIGQDCILPGTIPERPEGRGWKLEWTKQRKVRR